MDVLINDVKVAKEDTFKLIVGRNFIIACIEEHARALQTLANANVELKVALTDAVAKIRELLESGRSMKSQTIP